MQRQSNGQCTEERIQIDGKILPSARTTGNGLCTIHQAMASSMQRQTNACERPATQNNQQSNLHLKKTRHESFLCGYLTGRNGCLSSSTFSQIKPKSNLSTCICDYGDHSLQHFGNNETLHYMENLALQINMKEKK